MTNVNEIFQISQKDIRFKEALLTIVVNFYGFVSRPREETV